MSVISEIEHLFYLSSFGTKLEDLIRVLKLEQPESGVIFCNTKTDALYVTRGMTRRSYSIGFVSEDMSKTDRNGIISSLKSGKTRFIVTTDSAICKMNVSSITHIIYFDLPETSETYIQQTESLAENTNAEAVLCLVSGQDINIVAAINGIEDLNITEKNVPSMAEIADMEETRMIERIQKDMENFDSAEYISVAEKLLEMKNRDETVAFLLQNYFEQKKAPARVARRTAAPSQPEVKKQSKPEEPKKPAVEPKQKKAKPANTVKIFLSAGRKDRGNAQKIAELLKKETDIQEEDIGPIVVKDTYSFIEVSSDKVDSVTGLSGTKAFGKELRIEVAKSK